MKTDMTTKMKGENVPFIQSKSDAAAGLRFMKEREAMRAAGFPYCFSVDGVQMHCDACRAFWKKRQETHDK